MLILNQYLIGKTLSLKINKVLHGLDAFLFVQTRRTKIKLIKSSLKNYFSTL